MTLEKINTILMEHLILIKMLHFQTSRYGAHKALDKYLEKFLKNYDVLMEVAQGQYGRLSQKKMTLNATFLTDGNVFKYLNIFDQFLSSLSTPFRNDPDLLTIRDQMIVDLHQLMYLMTFS